MLKKSLISCLLILFSCYAYAERENSFPDVLEPYDYPFSYISADSINKLKSNIVASQGGDGMSTISGFDEIYLLKIDRDVYVAVYEDNAWKISNNSFKSWNDSYTLSILDLDNEGKGELLIEASSTTGRGGRYSGYDNSIQNYYVINVEKEYQIFLIENYRNEYHSYAGYTANDTGDYEREDEEMQDDDNWEYGKESCYGEIRAHNQELYFEEINCTEIADTVFAIVYKLQDDTLRKSRVVPQFKNMAQPVGYKALQGKVGKRTITMHLTQVGKYYTGYCYDNETYKYIELSDNSYYPNIGAPVVLNEMGTDNYFSGAIEGNTFHGTYLSGKKKRKFFLKEQYNDGAIKLAAYSFTDSVVGDRENRFDIAAEYYLADTSFVSKEDAIQLNNNLFGNSGYYGENLYRHPSTVFHSHRSSVLSSSIVEFDRHDEGAKYYSSTSHKLYYNRSQLISIMRHHQEFTGGARVGHMISTLIYDVEKKAQISTEHILSCTQEQLRNIIEKEYFRINSDSLAKHTVMAGENYTGEMMLRSDGFLFFFDLYPFTETIFIPYHMLQQYIKPEYRERLLK